MMYHTMLAFTLQLFTFFILYTTIAKAQPYKATDHFSLDCGSSSTTTSFSRPWSGDERSEFLPSNRAASFLSTPTAQYPPPPETLYTTARIFNTSSYTYTFPVSQGPKFLRLYFYPATYSDLNANQSFFAVSSNGFSLMTNFSAFITASFLSQECVVKEFIIYVKHSQILNVTFTPLPNSYAFINGIEIVSMPENLYFVGNNLKYVGIHSRPVIDNYTALENIYRLNVGGAHISGNKDTGMYRAWDGDDKYVTSLGLTPTTRTPITYTTDTPNYTAPELVYQTQRSMGKQSMSYNLTWLLPVDFGFYYMIRLHFCNIIPLYTFQGQMIFEIFINNQTAEGKADLFNWTPGSGYAVFKDYGLFVGRPDGQQSKQDLWLALHPNDASQEYHDGFLNGIEVFKLNMTGNLSSPNPQVNFTTPPSPPWFTSTRQRNKKTPYAVIAAGIGGGLLLLSILFFIVLRQRRGVKHYATADDKSSLPSDRCRRFSLKELKVATNNFNDNCVIGNGGFGKVYKGFMDNPTTCIAIKRLNTSSSQGFQEFHTEIAMLSKLRHVQLVSLIGYCDDEGEMILVYEYMANGTLREHLYKTNNPHLSWIKRLHICIGAAKGLHYLHTSNSRVIIHRDVKSTNILLDENWVAKVSDFGLSKLGPRDYQAQNHVSTVVKGSIGYIDPEYCRTQQLTDKSDVYSFGVVLFEVLCGRPVIIQMLPKEQVSLAEWGKSCYRKAILNQIVDSKVRDEIAPGCLMKFGEVAVNCLKEQGDERPTMEEVVWDLEFALQLQEGSTKTFLEVVPDNQEHPPLLMQGEPTTTDHDDDVFSGSTTFTNGTSSISSY